MGVDRHTAGTIDHQTRPDLPADFWDQLELQQACRERHFGHLLKSYRELQDPVMKQSELAKLLGITQGQVSRIERGRHPVTDLEKLARWASTLDIPPSILWFQVADETKNSCSANAGGRKIDVGHEEGDDVRRRQLIKSVGIGAALLGTKGIPDSNLTSTPSYRAVGMEVVETMRIMRHSYRRIDNRFGGGQALAPISQYIQTNVAPQLKDSRCSESVRKALFTAAAEMYQLAGWMSYDMGKPDQGRKCLSYAIRLCRDVDNRAFAAELLAGLSHQASHLRQSENAVDFALIAKDSANQLGIPALTAEAAVMAAHGFAQQGDKRACLAELREAEAAFVRIREDDSPEWLTYFDEAYLSAKFGHALKDLGDASQAECFARRSLNMSQGYERGRLFNTALLATTLAMQSKVDEAVSHGRLAVQMAGGMQSARTTTYLSEVAEHLQPFKTEAPVQTLYRQMTAASIPLQRV